MNFEETLLLGLSLFGIFAFFTTFFLNASYGRFSSTGAFQFVPKINGKVGFFIQELPSYVIPTYFFLMNYDNLSWFQTICFSLFILHYFQRSHSMSDTDYMIVSMAFAVTSVNGYLNSIYTLKKTETTNILQLGLGIFLFFLGFYFNIQSDSILISLRSNKKTDGQKYLIPKGGLFEYVSAANYFGESLEWFGFALACNHPASWIFCLFTLSNLVPRGYSAHKWYHTQFKDYPKERKAFFPFLF